MREKPRDRHGLFAPDNLGTGLLSLITPPPIFV
jgi:hypothetical protein